MGLSHIAIIAAIGLGGLLSGCSKTPPSPQRTQVAVANATTIIHSKTQNLGEIQLTNHFETEIDLGKGRSFTIVPRMVNHENLLLTLSFGSKNADGKPTGLCVKQMSAKPGQPFDFSANDVDMSFIPKLVE